MTTDDKIQDIVLGEITREYDRRSVFTFVGAMHPAIGNRVALQAGERVLFSTFFSRLNWSAFTTRRILATYYGECEQLDPSRGVIADWSWPRPGLTIREPRSNRLIHLEYESEARIPVITVIRYWELKHRVLHKLITSGERQAYILSGIIRDCNDLFRGESVNDAKV